MNFKHSIIKYITGSEAAEEKAALDDWKADSEENLAALKNIVDMQQQVSILKNYQEVDTSRAWANIEQKIQQNDAPKQKPNYILKIAASLLFIIAAIFVFNKINEGNNSVEYLATTNKTIDLQDGSHIWMQKNSKLNQTSYRNVSLDGQAYFDIAKDPKTPFEVSTHHGKITVLGTEFNIITSKDKTQIYVSEGKVKVEYAGKKQILEVSQMITISENEMAVASSPFIKPVHWKNKILSFENNNLRYVLESVAIYYNIQLDWQIKAKEDQCKINTVFKDETLEDVMIELALISGLVYEIKGKTIIVKSYKC
jgi:ferric-dicitrate binding protein FerR (iron transport regulator)